RCRHNARRAATRPSSRMPSHREPGEETFGAPLIGLDLRAQRIDVLEAALVAQPQHEAEAHALAIEVAVVAEQVRFDGWLRFAERRSQADVRNSRMHDAVDGHRG